MNINTVTISGNLTRDPETRQVGETSATSLRIAVNDRVKKNGEWVDRANYFDVTVWGRQGENCEKYLSRGSLVMVSGRLHWREWETDDGKRQAVSIVADRVQFGSNGGGNGSGGSGGSGGYAEDDDIPF